MDNVIITKQITYVNTQPMPKASVGRLPKVSHTPYEKALHRAKYTQAIGKRFQNVALSENNADALFTADSLLEVGKLKNIFVASDIHTADGELYSGYGSFNVTSSKLDSGYLKTASRRNYKRVVEALERGKVRGAIKHFLTLTQPTISGIGLEKTFAIADRAWALFRKREIFTKNIHSAVISQEFTLGENHFRENRKWSPKKDGFHVHRHLIAYGKWLDVRILRQHWTECLELSALEFGLQFDFKTADGLAVVNRLTVWNEEKSLRELSKYICKGSVFKELPDSELIAVESAIRNRRMFSTYGGCNKRVGRGDSVHLDTNNSNDGITTEQSSKPYKISIKPESMRDKYKRLLSENGLESARNYLRLEFEKRRQWRIENFLEKYPYSVVTDLVGNVYYGSKSCLSNQITH